MPQGLLSTTYLVEVEFTSAGASQTKGLFVKVPLTGPRAQDYKEVRVQAASLETF